MSQPLPTVLPRGCSPEYEADELQPDISGPGLAVGKVLTIAMGT